MSAGEVAAAGVGTGVTAKVTGTNGDSVLHPVMWMFIAILVTFLVTRLVTRTIRSGKSSLFRDMSVGSTHLHHQVFGILIMIASGITLVAATPEGAALNLAAAVFGVGISLTLDEFALWLHLQDVYWDAEGRKSVDAIFTVLAVTGILIGGSDLVSGHIGTAGWWSSIGWLAVGLLLSLVCVLKGKTITGVIGVVFALAALVGALRLAKPNSWWARRFYVSRPRRRARADRRFGARYEARWNRLRDLIAGAPETGLSADARPAAPDAPHSPNQ
jgi:hypothetical protein